MFKKITQDLLNITVEEFNKKENKERIKIYIIEPIISDILHTIYPYFLLIYLSILIPLIFILIKIYRK